MRIWFALLAAPVLALTDESIAYAAVSWACAHQNALALQAVHAPFLAVTAFATAAAWQVWRETRIARPGDETLARRHFIAGLATASAGIATLVVFAMWIPTWVLGPCAQ
jgi:hypothetical protein